MKTNFRKNNDASQNNNDTSQNNNDITNLEKEELTQEEFEDYVAKSGAKGSFMIYRSSKKDEELGLDEL